MNAAVRRFLLGLVSATFFAVLPNAFAADKCTDLIPAGGPYNVLRYKHSSDVQLMVDDFVYHHLYKTHESYINAGFSVDTLIYDVPLQLAGTFSQQTIDKWKETYERRTKIQYTDVEKTAFEQLLVDKNLVDRVTACIVKTRSFGFQTEFETSDDCTYTVRASYRPEIVHQAEIPRVKGIDASGGACGAWPDLSAFGRGPELPPRGTAITCHRNGRDPLIVRVNTDVAGSSDDLSIEGLPQLGPEPTDPGPTPRTVTIGPLPRLTGLHPELGFVDNDRKAILRVPLTITSGAIQSVGWRCAGAGCGFTWQIDIAGLNTNTATWIGKTNSADGGESWFDIAYLEPSDFPSKHAAWIREKARTCPAAIPTPVPPPWWCVWCTDPSKK